MKMTASDKFFEIWKRFFLIAGNIVFLLAFCLLLTTKETDLRDVTNLKLFGINLAILLCLCAGYLFMSGHPFKNKLIFFRHPLYRLLGGYVLLFILQCIYVHFTYFYTGWDVELMRSRVEAVLAGCTLQEISADVGFSINPNNLFLFYIQYLTAKAGELFSLEKPYNLCIYLSCFCVAASCFLGSLIIRKVTQNSFIRFLYTLSSTIFILFSPWIVIPYSDTYGMLFTTLGIWAVIWLEKPILKWPVLAFASLIGYLIKPTCIFTLLAAVILLLPSFVTGFRKKWKELCILLFSCLLFAGIALEGVPLWIQHSLSFQLDPELKNPPLHYMMIGLNMDSRGGFNESDYFFTASISTYAEKERLIKKEIERRWNQMTPEQKREHYTAKFLYNFNDGTFAWTKEGGFFKTPSEQDNWLNDLYKEVFYSEGKYFTRYYEFAQVIWLQLLLGILFLFLNLKEQTDNKAFLIIVLCGLLTFLMLFEARARYLYLYSPAFLILSLYGYEGLFLKLSKKLKSRGH